MTAASVAAPGTEHDPATRPAGAAPPTRWPMSFVLLASLAIAAISLPWRVSIGYDPWAWLVWGREILGLDLNTTGGPAWKPFPVFLTTPAALFGDQAPLVWLLFARAAGVLTIALAFRLASRFAGRIGGLLAAGLILLTPDGGPRFLRLVAEGHSEPFSAAFTLWAIERHLDGRPRQALLLATGVGLLRPEAWPFVLVYAAWTVHRDRRTWPVAAACLVALPVLWFGGDWLGSGDPLHGADTAQVTFDQHPNHVTDALRRAFESVVVPVWLAAAACVAFAWRRRDHVLVVLGAGSIAWCGVVIAENAAFKYAAISRFYLPSAVVLSVLAAIGLVQLVRLAPARGVAPVAVAAVLVAASAPFVVPRVRSFDPLVDEMVVQRDIERDLDAIVDAAGGPDALTACGRISYDGVHGKRPYLAWLLDIPMEQVGLRTRSRPGVLIVRRGGVVERDVLAGGLFETVATNATWRLLAGGCDDFAVEAAPAP